MQSPIIHGGYILLSRRLIDSGIMQKPPDYLKVWIYLLSKAQHTPKNNLQRGQGFASIPELIEVLSYKVGYRTEKATKKRVWGIIEWLRNPNERDYEGNAIEPMIETTKVTHGFVYTIVKYELYQEPKNYESNTESNNEGITKEQRKERQGNNKYKNDKNDKNDINISSCEEDEVEEKILLKFPVESIEYRLADFLRKWIKKNNPAAKVPTDKEMDKWSHHIDYMLRLDQSDQEDIKAVIEFCQKDDFWMTNILSTAKLRKQFDQLYLKSQQKSKAPTQTTQPPKQKTKFHLAKSRGDKYTAEELEALILNNQKNRLEQKSKEEVQNG